MLVVSLVMLGLAAYRDLGLDIFPKVDIPTVTVTTRLPGASPEEVESQVTRRIEEVVNTISGIDELRSTTIEGQSQVFVSFILDRDIEAAAQDVREKVATILSQLPQGTETPVVGKFGDDGVGHFLGRDEEGGHPVILRFTWSEITAAHCRWEQDFSPDEGRTWEKNWIMVSTREDR